MVPRFVKFAKFESLENMLYTVFCIVKYPNNGHFGNRPFAENVLFPDVFTRYTVYIVLKFPGQNFHKNHSFLNIFLISVFRTGKVSHGKILALYSIRS